MIITSYTKLNNAPNNKINIEDTLKLKILIRIIVIKEKAKIIALKDFKSMLLAMYKGEMLGSKQGPSSRTT